MAESTAKPQRKPKVDGTAKAKPKENIFDPKRWGLPQAAVEGLGEELHGLWERYHDCFTTKTRDTSSWALVYLKGMLLLPTNRNYVNIARSVVGPDEDGQELQQFMSESPWPAASVFTGIQEDISREPALRGGVLSLDESADAKAGELSAGAARQHNGRLGKVDVCQVGVALSYSCQGYWAMVDGELYMPEDWFDTGSRRLWKRLHIPANRVFQTKPQIGLDLIRRARARGLPFEVVACDSLYGRAGSFRAALAADGITYVADVPKDYHVYLSRPVVGVPPAVPGQNCRPAVVPRVLSTEAPVEVQSLAVADLPWEMVRVRSCERGHVDMPCWRRRVWVVKGDLVREEWLLLHREADGDIRYTLSNASVETPLATLAGWRAGRYFVERTFQDSKSELGWDEFRARKYRAWMHHTALNALALWFIARARLRWSQECPRDMELARDLEVENLPALSVANVRLLLAVVIPLPHLTLEQAIRLVIQHLFNRSRSTRSRLNKQARASATAPNAVAPVHSP
jgi:SRSO17 transposase